MMQQKVRTAEFPPIEKLKERAAEEKKRIMSIAFAAALLAVLCLIALIMYGRQQAINSELARAKKSAESSALSEAEEALEKYRTEAYLYKIYTENGDDYRAAHKEQLMLGERSRIGELEAEADIIDEALGIR